MVACGGGVQAQSLVRADFSETQAEINNPERGFYRAAHTSLASLEAHEVADAYAAGYRLIYVRIDLEAWRESDLPAAFIDRLSAGFATARQGGVKLILRATYNYPQGETGYERARDASLPRVKGHLAQLKPLLQANADVIAFVQAGFVGAWGEWHTSSNGLTTPENRTAVRDALLDAVPDTRFVQFRYPPYIREWTPNLPPLQTALSGAYRIGFHNDCFLASATDVGTYSEDADIRAGERAYNDALGDLAPFGGETCNPADDPAPAPRTACADILAEGARYNLTYLNDSYYRRLFHDTWTRQGCMDDVRRRMGYRLSLLSASHPSVAVHGAVMPLSVMVRNSGWARLYNPRDIEIVLRDRTTGLVRRIAAHGGDPRQWLPDTDTPVALTISLPADMPAGTYEVLLALPDPDARLRHDPRFAIRLANADHADKGQGWRESLGAFALGTQVEVR